MTPVDRLVVATIVTLVVLALILALGAPVYDGRDRDVSVDPREAACALDATTCGSGR